MPGYILHLPASCTQLYITIFSKVTLSSVTKVDSKTTYRHAPTLSKTVYTRHTLSGLGIEEKLHPYFYRPI